MAKQLPTNTRVLAQIKNPESIASSADQALEVFNKSAFETVQSLAGYLTNPSKDPIKKALALRGKYVTGNALSAVDASVRGSFSTAISIAKGTWKAASFVGSLLNSMNPAPAAIRSATETLIGKTKSDEMFVFMNEAMADLSLDLRNAVSKIAYNVTDKQEPTLAEFLIGASSVAIDRAKRTMGEAVGISDAATRTVEGMLALDIETGGLYKDAPIVQTGMAIGSAAQEVQEFLDKNPELVARMSPEEQMKAGFLNLQLVPEAIIRDQFTRDAFGNEREATYKAFTHLPASREQFEKTFGSWALNKEGYMVSAYYEEFADPDTGVIPEETLANIKAELDSQGYVELKKTTPAMKVMVEKTLEDGTTEIVEEERHARLYSQQTSATYAYVMQKLHSLKNGTLMAANLAFESFRTGKAQSYFIENTLTDKPNQEAFNVAMYPDSRQAINQSETILNLRNEQGELVHPTGIAGTDDMRSMYAATWRKHTKLNILDSNNYYYSNEMNKLRSRGTSNEMIDLFDQAFESTAYGLRTFDQLDFTKMLYSGLMHTGYMPMDNDVYSGGKIEWATETVLGETETHTATDDALKQIKLLTTGKLVKTVNDLFNIKKAATSPGFSDQLHAGFSVFRILADYQKRSWLDLQKIFRETNIGPIVDPKTGITYGGGNEVIPDRILAESGENVSSSATEILKRRNIDTELLKWNETLLGWTGDDDSLFAQTSSAQDQRGQKFVLEEGKATPWDGKTRLAPGAVVVHSNTSGIDPFSLGTESGVTRHEMRKSDGTSLFLQTRQHNWQLELEVRERFAELTGQGHTTESARSVINTEVLNKYAKTDSLKSRGIIGEDLIRRSGFLQAHFSIQPGGARGALKAILGGGKEASLESQIKERLGPAMQQAAQRAKQGVSINLGNFEQPAKNLFNYLTTSTAAGGGVTEKLSFSAQTADDTAAGIQRVAPGVGSVFRNLRNKKDQIAEMKVSEVKSMIAEVPKNLIKTIFNADDGLADWALKNGARHLGGMAAVGAIAVAGGVGYSIDGPSWKPTTKEVLKMTGEEREILGEGHRKKGGNLSSVTTSFTGRMDKGNPAGIALQAIDSSRVDYAVGDGDTIEILSKGFLGSGRQKLGSIRVSGMDAPEVAHAGGGGTPGQMPEANPAKQYLTNVLSGLQDAQVVIGGGETFGRAVGLVVDQKGTNYSYEMVKQGLASVLYREKPENDITDQAAYNAAENSARRSNSGMWSNPFYYEAQSGIAGADRKGWNKLSPGYAKKFNFAKSPGTSSEQVLEMTMPEAEALNPPNTMDMSEMFAAEKYNASTMSLNLEATGGDTGYAQKKALMADLQQTTLANAMQRNRGRGKDRR
jgi:endonuclease YncB( thermonuclease family)